MARGRKNYDLVLAWHPGHLVTDFSYVKDKKRYFRVAAQRVQDNLDTGEWGIVRDEYGKYFKIISGKRVAYPYSGPLPFKINEEFFNG